MKAVKKAAGPRIRDEGSDEPVEVLKPTILEDPVLDTASLKELRGAYRELRTAYGDLHKRHHEWITEALAELKKEDKKTGGDVPYGYRLASDNETLIEDAAEQAVIAVAVMLRERHFSFRRIAQELLKQKLRPRPVSRERREQRERSGLKTKRFGKFDPTQISRMIKAHKARTALAK